MKIDGSPNQGRLGETFTDCTMIKRIFQNRLFIPLFLGTALAISTFYSRSSINNGFGLKKIIAGLQTCSNRTNQTFTATMINEMSSGFVTEDFMNLTDECLAELNTIGQKSILIGDSLKDNLSELSEKTHWFHQKVLKILASVKNAEGSTSFNTFDIASRYEVLDLLRNDGLTSLEAIEAANIDTTNTWLAVTTFLALILLGTLSLIFGNNYLLQRKVDELESTANNILTNSNMMVASADRLFIDYFKLRNLNGLRGLFARYSEDILTLSGPTNSSVNQTRVEQVKTEIQKGRPSFDLSDTLESSVESLQKQALKHKVRIDANWDQSLKVIGTENKVSEGLRDLFVDLLDKSHSHQMGRRLTIRTRLLGGTTYLKVAIKDYCFNTSYLDFESSLANRPAELTKKSVQAYKTLSQENVKIVFKNGLDDHGKIANAVVEVIFDTARPEDIDNANRKTARIVKGSKSELLNSLSVN